MTDHCDAESDHILLARFVADGDRDALGRIFERHSDVAYRLARRYLATRQDAEDAVHDAFLAAMRAAPTYAERSTVRTWLLGFVVQTSSNARRGGSRRLRRQQLAAAVAPTMSDAPVDAETAVAVRTALEQLPERCRIPLWLHHVEGLSSREIADLLGRPASTVRDQVGEGLARLRGLLGPSLAGVALIAALPSLGAGECASARLHASLANSLRPMPPAPRGATTRAPGHGRHLGRWPTRVAWLAVVVLAGVATMMQVRGWTAAGHQSADETAGRSHLAINLGGESVLIDGQRWLGQAEAEALGLRIDPAPQLVPTGRGYVLNPPVDSGRAAMLSSCIFTHSGRLTLRLPLANGRYGLRLWLTEDFSTGYRVMTLRAEGRVLATGVAEGMALGEWQELGPYEVTVADGELELVAEASGHGVSDPHLMGLMLEPWNERRP